MTKKKTKPAVAKSNEDLGIEYSAPTPDEAKGRLQKFQGRASQAGARDRYAKTVSPRAKKAKL